MIAGHTLANLKEDQAPRDAMRIAPGTWPYGAPAFDEFAVEMRSGWWTG